MCDTCLSYVVSGSMSRSSQLAKVNAGIRAKVEHPFRLIKRQFSYVKVKYRALPENMANLMTLFALRKLWMARRRLLQGLQG